ncbi:MAG: hypothetical protein ACPG32_05785 [Akkermansiaceae bacterium]
MKKLQHLEFTGPAWICFLIGGIMVYLGFSTDDSGNLGMGSALISTGVLMLRRHITGTIMFGIIMMVLAVFHFIVDSTDTAAITLLKSSIGFIAVCSILYLQYKYHDAQTSPTTH